ncbi:MAG: hypothetical protein Q7T55_12335, partial [Solirubrobacteraceae bacterium]|nr:hypothetical protein [Solirubrobacteraceae bacterium]
MPPSTRRLRLGLLGLALVAVAPTTAVATSLAGKGATRAQAAPVVVSITETDELGDVPRSYESLDILSATVTQDRTNGIFTAKVELAGDPRLLPTSWLN